jgi:hypothetical protein
MQLVASVSLPLLGGSNHFGRLNLRRPDDHTRGIELVDGPGDGCERIAWHVGTCSAVAMR